MKHIKKLSLLAVALLILVAQLIIPAAAASNVLADLIPSKNTSKGKLTLTGCTMTENSDGSVTFTLTATEATFKMAIAENVYQEESGGTIYSGDAFDITKGAFVVYDYASADGVKFTEVIAHYTRKDKAASSALADLYLNSMEGTDFKDYQKQAGEGYGVWDLGTYVTKVKKDTGVFDNKMHRFCDLTGKMSGKVGAKITIYKFYVSSTDNVTNLGKVRPEPTQLDTSSSVTSSEVTSSVDTSSDIPSQADSSETSSVANESSTASTSSAASSTQSTVSNTSSAAADAESDNNTLTYVLIGVGAVIIIGAVVFFVLKKKK